MTTAAMVRGMLAAAVLTACGGGGGASSGSTNSGVSSGGGSVSSSGGAGASGGSPSGGSGGGDSTAGSSGSVPSRRGGLSIHIQNVRAHGNLPDEPSTRLDHLDVSFELDLQHNGTEPLTGLHIERVRLVEDEGRSIVIGVNSDAWNGQLEVGEHRVVLFTKTPDSASPPPTHAYCSAWMRLEVTIELAGRRSTSTSRRVQITCP